jgi:hypothetical protein
VADTSFIVGTKKDTISFLLSAEDTPNPNIFYYYYFFFSVIRVLRGSGTILKIRCLTYCSAIKNPMIGTTKGIHIFFFPEHVFSFFFFFFGNLD